MDILPNATFSNDSNQATRSLATPPEMFGLVPGEMLAPVPGEMLAPVPGDANEVTLLLRDGGRLSLRLADPLEQAVELARMLVDRGPGAPSLTIRLADGSTLMLPSQEVLALNLPPAPAASETLRTWDLPEPPDRGSETGIETHRMGQFRIIRVRNFLPSAIADGLHRYAVAREADYVQSRVCSNDPEYRKSVVLFSFPEYERMFRQALTAAFPAIVGALGVAPFALGTSECQLTATLDGGYFKAHTDNAAKMGYRRITFVYYVHKQPRPYEGGEIRFLSDNPYGTTRANPHHSLEFTPEHNSIVLFDSSCYHEVLETTCPAGGFRNARFTLNGWLGTERPKAYVAPGPDKAKIVETA